MKRNNGKPLKTGPKRKEVNVREVRRLAALGCTQKEIAGCLGMHQDTYYERKKENPEISEAYRQGLSYGISRVAGALFENAINGDTSAQIFFLKARAKWSDRIELVGDPENPIQHVISAKPLTAEEWEEKYGLEEKKIPGDCIDSEETG